MATLSADGVKTDRTIRIAGAGPAGLAAATLLAKEGFSVRVYEARPDVAARWKRGLQIIENFSEEADVLDGFRKAGLQINFDAKPVYGCTLWDGKKKSSAFNSKDPLGYYVKRGSFEGALDRGLLDQARDAGVEIHFNSPKSPNDDIQIFSTGPRRINGLGKEVTFQTTLSDRMTVILDPVLAPGGYAYLFVVDHQATLGMAILENFKRVDAYYEKTVERFKQMEDIRIEGGEISYSYANFFTKRTLMPSGRLLLGEAGGFQDYLFGFGIRYAIQSAILGARSIRSGVSYDELWKESLGRKQDVTLWNRFMYEKCRHWLPGLFIALAARSPDFRGYMRSWYRTNLLKSVTAGWIKQYWKKRNIHVDELKPYEYTELNHR